MNENWAIALASTVGGLLALVLGWIAVELREMRHELKIFVRRDDCVHSMDDHCGRLDELSERVGDNEAAIRELVAKTEIWHGK